MAPFCSTSTRAAARPFFIFLYYFSGFFLLTFCAWCVSGDRDRRHWVLSVRHKGAVRAAVLGEADPDRPGFRPAAFALGGLAFPTPEAMVAAVNSNRVPVPWRLTCDLSRRA